MAQTNEFTTAPTTLDALSFAEISAGHPEVVVFSDTLKTPVTWAHVLSDASAISLLDGGELVLTTGAGWEVTGAELKKLTLELAKAAPAAVILELGRHFKETPPQLVAAFAAQKIALIVLKKQVRFVQITQRVHKQILAAQHESLEARDKVHQMLNELGINRSPVDYTVAQLAATLDSAVVLENIAGEVVAWGAPQTKTTAAKVLKGWLPGGSIQVYKPLGSEQDTERIAVEARGKRFGYITALPGPAHPAGRKTVLELGALALALGRLSNHDSDEWIRLSSKRLIDDMLTGRYRHDVDLVTQLEASGLPIKNRDLFALSITGINDFGGHTSLEKVTLETALRRAISPSGKTLTTFLSDSKDATLLALVSMPVDDSHTKTEMPEIALALAEQLEKLAPISTPKDWQAHLAIGSSGHQISNLLTSLAELNEVGRLPHWRETGRVRVQTASKQPLTYLLRSFAGSQALQQFIQEQLGPLIEYDKNTGPGFHQDLLKVLAAYLENPNNRSAAAKKSRLSRSVFYSRLELIEDILGVDLNSGETIIALGAALKAHQI